MITNEEKSWKYQLPFNNDVYRNVKHFSFLHTPAERKILDAQIEFYRHNFSIDQLLYSFSQCEEGEIAHFKEVVYKRRKDILYCPNFLQKYYYNIIKKQFKEHSEFLLEMLSFAMKKRGNKNPMLPIYKLVLGDYYLPIKKQVKKYSKRDFVDTFDVKIMPNDYIKHAMNILDGLSTDYLTHGIFGEFTCENIDIYKHTGYGNCELKSAQFYPGKNDSFTITTGNNTLKLEELRHNIYANVYPGRAHFYNNVMYRNAKLLDLGATFLLNGWDTFVSWHTRPSAYTRNSKSLYGKICSYLVKGNYKKALKNLNVYLLATYNTNKARELMISITQYPGLIESYMFGGLATELLIKNEFAASPADLLKQYRKVNLGDFFALYKK